MADNIERAKMTRRRLLGTTALAAASAALEAGSGAQGAPSLATPTPEQAAWQAWEQGMFIHFAPNTWQDREGDDLSTPLSRINPARLDTDQWVEVAQSMGARYIVFVAKHVGGFCMWQTKTTDYGIKDTPWRDGKGDVLHDLSRSCHQRGVRLGIYLSPRDDKHGVGLGGRCATPQAQAAYDRLYREQLTEVLSRYGEMAEVWFDGNLVIEVGDILHRYAPKAMIFQSQHATIRWVGNEDGFAPYPAWNAVPAARARAGDATAADGDPNGDAWLPIECDARIRADWFWNSHNAGTLKTVPQLMEMYYRSVGHGAVLLLDHVPDTTGLIPEADARRAREFGEEIRRRFAKPLAEAHGRGSRLEVRLPHPSPVDHAILMEDIRHGERVREYAVDVWTDGGWKEVAAGSAIGHKKIDRFEPVTASRARFRCVQSAAEPILRKLAIYSVGKS